VTPWVTRLLIANVVLFFVQQTMPGVTYALMFVPMRVLLQPWTIYSMVTYMFLHAGFSHILFNMIALYFFGPRVEDRLGPKRFIWLYMISGVSGALLSFFFAPRAAVIGASGAIFGVTLAFAYFWPRAQILIWGILPVEAWLLVGVYTLLALFGGFGGGGGGVAHFAHLGGFVGAWAYLKWLDRTSGHRTFRAKSTPKVIDKSLTNWKKVDVSRVHEVNRDELNRILDKISKSGLGSLTPQERVFLSNFVPPDDRIPPPT
jgi:membrane associated rhomboid family serine protease